MNIFSSNAVKKASVLLGLFFLIHVYSNAQSCNCPAIGSCGPCDSGFTSITLRYNGPFTVAISANDGGGVIYFDLLVNTGEIFTVEGSLFNGKFNSNSLSLYVTAVLNFSINTNCGTPVSINQTFGSFTVLAAESYAGGPLCCDAGDLETTDPVISGCPTDIQVSSDVAGCSKAVNWIPPTATDNCGDVILTSTHSPGAVFPVGATEVTYTATDEYGNTSTCSFDINVEDETDPVITGCPVADVIASANPACEATVTWTAPIATDNCAVVTYVSTHSPGDVFPRGATIVTYTATDAAGNTAACSFNIIVNDDTDPVFMTCPAADVIVVADVSCEAIATWPIPTASDNCSPLTIVSSHSPGDIFPIGTTTVQYSATDPAGNVAVCSFDVVVNDESDPVLSGCPPTDIVSVANAACEAVVTWTVPTASDNCGVVSLVSSHAPGDTFTKGTTIVSYTATDAAGNFSTCTFNVIVNDETPPVIAGCVTSDILVTANALCQATVSWATPSASDNCGSVTLTTNYDPGHVFSLGTTQVIYSAEDSDGNISTCEFNVVVQDDSDPVIVGCTASDIIASANASCQAVVSWTAPTASDNCSLDSFTSSHLPGDLFPLGTTVVLYTATDGAGNIATCSFNVVVNDTTDPVISGCITTDILVTADASCQAVATWTPPVVSDNCGPVTMISSHAPGSTFPLGTTVVAYTASDGFSNTSMCTFNVIVEDLIPPAISGCIATDIIIAANGLCQAAATWTLPTVTDNCGVTLTSTHDPGDIFPFGTTEVTYTATDVAGNIATCTFNVIVEDETIPQFTGCISTDIVVFADASCQATATWTPPTAADNCTAAGVESTHLPGDVFPLGTTQVTYTATDGSGNTATCVFSVVVVDNVSPLIAGCISTDIVAIADGSCGAMVSWTVPTATDNCGSPTLTSSHNPGETFPLGTTIVTYTATDNQGNISVCSFNVKVNDQTDPVLVGCINSDIVISANGACEALVSWTAPIASDNCGATTLTPSHFPGSIFPVGTTIVSYIATDGSGNTAECFFRVIVEDNTSPVLSGCPPTDIILNTDASCGAVATWTTPTFSDNCAGVAMSGSHNPGDVFSHGTTQVVYTATDVSGNTTTCAFNVIVVDNVGPVFSGCFTSDITVIANSSCEATVTWIEPIALDDCGDVTMTRSHRPGEVLPLGRTTVTYTATDASGNNSECSFDVVVTDGIAPALTSCQDVVVAAGSACNAGASWSAPVAVDCSSFTLVSTHNPGDLFPMGSTEVTYTATDSYGNISSCTFNVIVEDKITPVIQNCVNDIVVTATTCDAVVTWAAPTVFDNCGNVTTVKTHSPGDAFPLGTTMVSYTATDDSGNSAVCKFNIIVKNETPPTLEDCPDDITATADEFGEATAEWHSPSASATCGEVAVTSSHKSGDTFRVGTTTVEYSAVDISGNISQCRFNVTVVKQEIDIEISQVVTPDGNGVNDELIVANIEKFNNNKIVIVDRWGSVIYAASGYNNGSIVWKGVNQEGSTVPTGTYFYSLSVRYGEDFIEKTGFIELIR